MVTLPPCLRPALGAVAIAAVLACAGGCARQEALPENRITVAYAAPAEVVVAQPYAAVLRAAREVVAAAGCTAESADEGAGSVLRLRERQFDGARYWIYQPSIAIVSDAVQTDAGRRPYRWRVVDLRYPDGIACRHDAAKAYESDSATVDAETFTLPYVDGCVLAAGLALHLQPAGAGETRVRIEVVSARGPYREAAVPGGPGAPSSPGPRSTGRRGGSRCCRRGRGWPAPSSTRSGRGPRPRRGRSPARRGDAPASTCPPHALGRMRWAARLGRAMSLRVPRLGHPLLDRQHARLLLIGRALLRAVRRGHGLGELGELMRATTRHFVTEDRLMRGSAYPEAAGHRSLHDGVVREMRALQAVLRAGRVPHPRFAERIVAWLGHHTDEADRNLVAHLQARVSARGRRRATRG